MLLRTQLAGPACRPQQMPRELDNAEAQLDAEEEVVPAKEQPQHAVSRRQAYHGNHAL